MKKTKIILDTDIGSDIDDAYALVFALNSPEIQIKAIITNNSNVEKKAQIVRAFTKEIPIFKGIEINKGFLTTTIGDPYYKTESFQDNLDFFNDKDIIYVSIGALSNLAYFLDKGIKFKKVVIMGGSINLDYKGRRNTVLEWNLNSDLNATKKVFNSDLNILLVTLDSTWNLELNEKQIEMIRKNNKPTPILLTKHLDEMRDFLLKRFNIHFKKPVLHDPLSVYASFGDDFFSLEEINLKISDNGLLYPEKKGKKMKVVTNSKREFIDFFMNRILK